MKVTARVQNERGRHEITLVTNGKPHTISIPPNDSGFGSKANGGELLFPALATCNCNDIYREAARRDIQVSLVEVEVTGDFGGPGEPARNVTYVLLSLRPAAPRRVTPKTRARLGRQVIVGVRRQRTYCWRAK
jgi:organic hydroperoxide reductase OsmC/OhrA